MAAQAADMTVGFIGTFSGSGANLSRDQLDGFRLGVKDLGGRLGGVEFALSVLDDHHEPEQALAEAQRLWDGGRVHFLLLSSAPRSSALIAPLAVKGHSFVLNLGSPAVELEGKGCLPNYFSLSGTPEEMHEISGQYLQQQGYHRIAMVGLKGEAMDQSVAAFQRGFKGQILPIASSRGTMNFHDDLQKLRSDPPDGIYLLHTGGMAVEFLLQFAESHLKSDLPLFGPATTLDKTILDASGTASLDAFSVGPWSDDLDSPANHRMMAEFESEYGRSPSFEAALGYDAAMLMDGAIRMVDKKINDEDAMRMALRRVDFPSTRGNMRFDSNHFPIQSYLLRQVVEDPRGRLISEQRGILIRDMHDPHASECPMRWTPAELLPPPNKK